MKALRVLTMIILISFGAGLAGCGGGEGEVKKHTAGPTVGKELTDLKSAYEKGAISKEEYEKAKEKILERD